MCFGAKKPVLYIYTNMVYFAQMILIQLSFFKCHAPPISNIFSEKGQKRIRYLIIPCCGPLSSTTQASNAWNCRMNSARTNHKPCKRIFHLCHKVYSELNPYILINVSDIKMCNNLQKHVYQHQNETWEET